MLALKLIPDVGFLLEIFYQKFHSILQDVVKQTQLKRVCKQQSLCLHPDTGYALAIHTSKYVPALDPKNETVLSTSILKIANS